MNLEQNLQEEYDETINWMSNIAEAMQDPKLNILRDDLCEQKSFELIGILDKLKEIRKQIEKDKKSDEKETSGVQESYQLYYEKMMKEINELYPKGLHSNKNKDQKEEKIKQKYYDKQRAKEILEKKGNQASEEEIDEIAQKIRKERKLRTQLEEKLNETEKIVVGRKKLIDEKVEGAKNILIYKISTLKKEMKQTTNQEDKKTKTLGELIEELDTVKSENTNYKKQMEKTERDALIAEISAIIQKNESDQKTEEEISKLTKLSVSALKRKLSDLKHELKSKQIQEKKEEIKEIEEKKEEIKEKQDDDSVLYINIEKFIKDLLQYDESKIGGYDICLSDKNKRVVYTNLPKTKSRYNYEFKDIGFEFPQNFASSKLDIDIHTLYQQCPKIQITFGLNVITKLQNIINAINATIDACKKIEKYEQNSATKIKLKIVLKKTLYDSLKNSQIFGDFEIINCPYRETEISVIKGITIEFLNKLLIAVTEEQKQVNKSEGEIESKREETKEKSNEEKKEEMEIKKEPEEKKEEIEYEKQKEEANKNNQTTNEGFLEVDVNQFTKVGSKCLIYVIINNSHKIIRYINSSGKAIKKWNVFSSSEERHLLFRFDEEFNSQTLDINIDAICENFLMVTIYFEIIETTKLENIKNIIMLTRGICEQIKNTKNTPIAACIISNFTRLKQRFLTQENPMFQYGEKNYGKPDADGAIKFLDALLTAVLKEQEPINKSEGKIESKREEKSNEEETKTQNEPKETGTKEETQPEVVINQSEEQKVVEQDVPPKEDSESPNESKFTKTEEIENIQEGEESQPEVVVQQQEIGQQSQLLYVPQQENIESLDILTNKSEFPYRLNDESQFTKTKEIKENKTVTKEEIQPEAIDKPEEQKVGEQSQLLDIPNNTSKKKTESFNQITAESQFTKTEKIENIQEKKESQQKVVVNHSEEQKVVEQDVPLKEDAGLPKESEFTKTEEIKENKTGTKEEMQPEVVVNHSEEQKVVEQDAPPKEDADLPQVITNELKFPDRLNHESQFTKTEKIENIKENKGSQPEVVVNQQKREEQSQLFGVPQQENTESPTESEFTKTEKIENETKKDSQIKVIDKPEESKTEITEEDETKPNKEEKKIINEEEINPKEPKLPNTTPDKKPNTATKEKLKPPADAQKDQKSLPKIIILFLLLVIALIFAVLLYYNHLKNKETKRFAHKE